MAAHVAAVIDVTSTPTHLPIRCDKTPTATEAKHDQRLACERSNGPSAEARRAGVRSAATIRLFDMERLFLFPGSLRRDPAVDAWLRTDRGELGAIARHWFQAMRDCGDDVRELLHDGHPTACVSEAAFGYVNAFTAHVNVGFFRGAELPDPERLLEGTGRFMRHVKIRPEREIDAAAITHLIRVAYADMKQRLSVD
jgi:hypothetical protein